MTFEINSLEKILHSLVDNSSFHNKVNLLRFQKKWVDFVGVGMREQSWPVKYEYGRLIVVVRDTVWRQELIFHNKKLIKKINRSGFFLKDIYYIIGKPKPLENKEYQKNSLNEEEKKFLMNFKKTFLQKIPSDSLRKSFLRLKTKQIQYLKTTNEK